MKNKAVVTIGSAKYVIVGAESKEYIEKLAGHVDTKMTELLQVPGMSDLKSAVLTAVNLCDEYFKAIETAENLRLQLRTYFEDASKMKSEINELRRELEQKSRR